jgi:tetratricopeptide (TPR) repeat protein
MSSNFDAATANFLNGLISSCNELIETGRYEEADANLRKIGLAAPEAEQFIAIRARLLQRRKQLPLALWLMRQAVVLNPHSREFQFRLGGVLMDSGSPGQAVSVFRKILSQNADNPDVQHNTGLALLADNRPLEAEPHLRRAMALKPESQSVKLDLARCLNARGMFCEARVLILESGLDGLTPAYREFFRGISVSCFWTKQTFLESERDEKIANHLSTQKDGKAFHFVYLARAQIDLDHVAPILKRLSDNHPDFLLTLILLEPSEVVRNPVWDLVSGLPGLLIVSMGDIYAYLGNEASLDRAIRLLARPNFRTIFASDGTSHNLIHQLRRLCDAYAIEVVSLPHGEPAIVNHLQAVDDLSLEKMPKSKNWYSLRIYSSDLHRAFEEARLENSQNGRTAVLGSVRYSNYWIKHLSSLPSPWRLEPDGRLKIALFLINSKFAVWWEEVWRTVRMLLQRPNVHLVIQKHPREYKKFDDVNLCWKELPDGGPVIDADEFCDRHPTSKLTIVPEGIPGTFVLRSVDVSMAFGTSIILESLQLRKPSLELSYLHANKTLVSREMPECDIRCRDDLLNLVDKFMEKIRIGRDISSFYNEVRLNQFLMRYLELNGEVNTVDRVVECFRQYGKTPNYS